MRKGEIQDLKTADQYYGKYKKMFLGLPSPSSVEEIAVRLLKNREATFTVRGNLHCSNGKLRSFDDYINVSKCHFPYKSTKEILDTFNRINKQKSIASVNYCPNIKKDNAWSFNYWNSKPYVNTPKVGVEARINDYKYAE